MGSKIPIATSASEASSSAPATAATTNETRNTPPITRSRRPGGGGVLNFPSGVMSRIGGRGVSMAGMLRAEGRASRGCLLALPIIEDCGMMAKPRSGQGDIIMDRRNIMATDKTLAQPQVRR